MKRNNNISKPIYDEMKVDEAVKLAMSETPQEEFELELLQTLSQYDKWKDDNQASLMMTFSKKWDWTELR